MKTPTGKIVYLHTYRELGHDAEKQLQKLLWRLLEEKHNGDILAAAEDFALARAGEITQQMLSKGVVDRDELYDAMIAWALDELGELDELKIRA